MLTTDASDTAIGATLEQQQPDKSRRPLGFFSRKLSPTEQRYSTYDRELLAIYSAIQFFKHQLEARHFVVRTDHKPLIYAFTQRPDKASPRQFRHLDFISQFTTQIVYLPGTENVVADAFSRIDQIDMPVIVTTQQLQEAQANDAEPQQILESNSTLKLQQLVTDDQGTIYCDVSAGNIRPYVPLTLRQAIFNAEHGLSHPGGRATCQAIRQRFVWPGMKKNILQWARTCIPCQRAKIQRHTRNAPGEFELPKSRFEHIHMDIVGPLTPSHGFKYILTIIDRFSRWPEAVPIKEITADTVATAFYANWIARFGSPRTLTTDQGSQFETALFKALTNLIGAQRTRSSPYHPAANGIIER